jgi:hypothetical protein
MYVFLSFCEKQPQFVFTRPGAPLVSVPSHNFKEKQDSRDRDHWPIPRTSLHSPKPQPENIDKRYYVFSALGFKSKEYRVLHETSQRSPKVFDSITL